MHGPSKPGNIGVHEERGGVPNKKPFDEYWDGYNTNDLDLNGDSKDQARNRNVGDSEGSPAAILFRRKNRQLAFWGCLRAQFLEDLSLMLTPRCRAL
ncbi:hypothetical protein F5X99DRAFT_368998 [Biscogniauxia marginata]|nr:hypothetical protein F5X99DRAFT_368998 [Biscogniauxia marginata]